MFEVKCLGVIIGTATDWIQHGDTAFEFIDFAKNHNLLLDDDRVNNIIVTYKDNSLFTYEKINDTLITREFRNLIESIVPHRPN